MAIRSFSPTYCNTCIHFDLDKVAKERAPLFCKHREIVTDWDHRACVLFTPVNDNTRQARRLIVEQLYADKKRREGEANNAAQGGASRLTTGTQYQPAASATAS